MSPSEETNSLDETIERSIEEIKSWLEEPFEANYDTFSEESQKKAERVKRALSQGVIDEEKARKRLQKVLHEEIERLEKNWRDRGKEEKELFPALPVSLNPTKLQSARGRFSSKNRKQAIRDLRPKVRQILEAQSEEEVKRILVEAKALSEIIRDNTHSPISVVLNEVKQFYEKISDALE